MSDLSGIADSFADCVQKNGIDSDACKKYAAAYNAEVDDYVDAQAAYDAAECECYFNPKASGCVKKKLVS